MSKELEALEKVNKVLESCYEYEKKTGKNAIVHISKEPLIEIQQALIKSQEQEKVLEIIKEKNVDIFFIKSCKTLQIYNVEICKNSPFAYGLTQEEFDLLKRYLDNEH